MMEAFALFALNWFYYQSWLVTMAFTYMEVEKRNERMATAAYVFFGYLAVAWHPLIDELFRWLKQ